MPKEISFCDALLINMSVVQQTLLHKYLAYILIRE